MTFSTESPTTFDVRRAAVVLLATKTNTYRAPAEVSFHKQVAVPFHKQEAVSFHKQEAALMFALRVHELGCIVAMTLN